MRWYWSIVLCACVACEQTKAPEATSEPPVTSGAPEATPAAPTKPAPPAPPEPEAEPEAFVPFTRIYPSSEFFEEGVIVSLQGGKHLDEVRELMKDPRARARIEVHTNPRGSGAYNMKMSKERAASLLGVLSEESATFEARVQALGLGEDVAPPEGVEASRVVIEVFDVSTAGALD